jgi:hypothetical protein
MASIVVSDSDAMEGAVTLTLAPHPPTNWEQIATALAMIPDRNKVITRNDSGEITGIVVRGVVRGQEEGILKALVRPEENAKKKLEQEAALKGTPEAILKSINEAMASNQIPQGRTTTMDLMLGGVRCQLNNNQLTVGGRAVTIRIGNTVAPVQAIVRTGNQLALRVTYMFSEQGGNMQPVELSQALATLNGGATVSRNANGVNVSMTPGPVA